VAQNLERRALSALDTLTVVPGAVGAGVYQINLAINTMIASGIANGAVSYLNYAERVNQLPLGVVGVAIGTALLPLMSRQIKAGQHEEALEAQNRAMEAALLLTLPASAALLVIATPVVAVLFERGAFGPADTAAVGPTLALLAAGLPAYVLVKVLTPGFFAREDTATPVRIAMGSMVLNICLNLVLERHLAWLGMALSTAIAAWINVILLAVFLYRRDFFTIDHRLFDRVPRILMACAGMMVVLLMAKAWLVEPLGLPGWRFAALAALIGAGIVSYGVFAYVMEAFHPHELRALVRRR
jgi:putative peptidoglycan lipid II flippase